MSQQLSAGTTEIHTGRGRYRLTTIGPAEELTGAIVVTLALEHSAGIEKIAFCVRISRDLIEDELSSPQVAVHLAPWIEREFEQIRETALKSIRAERALLQIQFDRTRPGPFVQRR